MFVEIIDRDETRLLRRLGPYEHFDPAWHADACCQNGDVTRSNEIGAIPPGCADFRCEVRRTKAPSPVAWNALNFFVAQDGGMP